MITWFSLFAIVRFFVNENCVIFINCNLLFDYIITYIHLFKVWMKFVRLVKEFLLRTKEGIHWVPSKNYLITFLSHGFLYLILCLKICARYILFILFSLIFLLAVELWNIQRRPTFLTNVTICSKLRNINDIQNSTL